MLRTSSSTTRTRPFRHEAETRRLNFEVQADARLIVDVRLAVDSGLMEGDVVHSLNRAKITTVDGLRAEFNQLKPGDPAALQVERNGKLTYITFQME